MGNKKSKKGLVILLLLLAVVLMTIGFAAYTQTLTINGTVGVTASSWNVLYNNTAGSGNGITTGSGSASATTAVINTNDTNFEFDVTLAEPGDYYEATIYPHNYGTITAYLKSITMNATCTDGNFANYFSYTLTYNNGTPYTASASGITGQSLAAGAQVPVTIRVTYVQPENASQLPSTNQTVTVSGSLGYSSEA